MAYMRDLVGDDLYPLLTAPDESDMMEDPSVMMGVYPSTGLSEFEMGFVNPNMTSMLPQQHHQSQSDQQNLRTSAGDGNGHAQGSGYGNLKQEFVNSSMPTSFDNNATSCRMAPVGVSIPNGSRTTRTSSPNMNEIDPNALKDPEEILSAPVKSLTDEEKKLRRRAQVAKSARKHRNRQKEELSRLRLQVQQLQEEMARMNQGSKWTGQSSNGESEVEMAEAICQHRKRKKQEDLSTETALTQPQQGELTTAFRQALYNSASNTGSIQHWFHHLPSDTEQRRQCLKNIVSSRLQMVMQFADREFAGSIRSFPHLDIKLSSNGPDMEIKLIRAKKLKGFRHEQVCEAAWRTSFNFQLDIPPQFKGLIRCERLMEVDENTRYGCIIAPLLRLSDENNAVFMHTYIVVHRYVTPNRSVLVWENIASDELYPSEPDANVVRNDEIGSMIFETETLRNGEVQTYLRCLVHATPPISAIAKPFGRISESFLTAFCRSSDIIENSARKYLVTQLTE